MLISGGEQEQPLDNLQSYMKNEKYLFTRSYLFLSKNNV